MFNRCWLVFVFLFLLVSSLFVSSWDGVSVYRNEIFNKSVSGGGGIFVVNGSAGWYGKFIYYAPVGSGFDYVYFNDSTNYFLSVNDTYRIPFFTAKDGLNSSAGNVTALGGNISFFTFDVNQSIFQSVDYAHYNLSLYDNGLPKFQEGSGCVFGGCLNFSVGTRDSVNGTIGIGKWHTWGFWFYVKDAITGASSAEAILHEPTYLYGVYTGGMTGDLTGEVISLYDGTAGRGTACTTNTNAGWNMVVYRWTGTHYEIYLNGANCTIAKSAIGHAILQDNKRMIFGYRPPFNDYDFTGSLDNFFVSGRVFGVSEIAELYRNGVGVGGVGQSVVGEPVMNNTPFVSVVSPVNNTHNDSMINITLNCTSTPNSTYYLWFDDSSEPTTPVLVNSTNNFYTTSVSVEGAYRFRGACYDTTNKILSDNSSIYVWFYDVSSPVLSLLGGNEFNSNGFVVNNPFDGLFVLNLSFVDNIGLFGVRVLLYDEDDVLLFNFTNVSMGGVTAFNYSNYSVNVSGLSGNVSVNITASDVHTASFIGDYDVVKSVDTLSFSTEEGNLISVVADGAVDSVALKEFDRYSFEFSFDDVKDSGRVFDVISSNGRVVHIPSSPFKAHFVVWNPDVFGGNWVDFEGVGGVPLVERVSDSHYRVSFSDLKDDVVRISSIGGLNVLNEDFEVFVGEFDSSSVSVYSGANTSLWVNLSKGGFSVVNATINLSGVFYNGSVVEGVYYWNISSFVTPVSNGSLVFNVSFFGVNPDDSVFSSYFNGTLTSFFWNISTCAGTLYNFTALEFFIYNEDAPSVSEVNNTFEIVVTIGVSGASPFSKNFSFSGDDNYSLCITDNMSVSSDGYVKWSVNDGFTNRYYWYDVLLNGSSSWKVYLYGFNYTSGVSDLRITARDYDTYAYKPDVLGVLERYYLGENAWRVVQMDLSDDYGLLFYNVLEEVVDYRLRFYDTSNNLLKDTGTLKFACSGGVCDLISIIADFGVSVVESNIGVVWSFDNSTSILRVNFTDYNGVISSVRVYVARSTISGDVLLFNDTIVGVSGGKDFNLSGVSGEVLVRVWSSSSPESGEVAWWLRIPTARELFSVVSSFEGALAGFLLLVVIVFVGLVSPVAVVVLSVVGIIFLGVIGLLSVVNTAFVILAVVMGLVLAFKMNR